jgi:RecA/RadA recombinase
MRKLKRRSQKEADVAGVRRIIRRRGKSVDPNDRVEFIHSGSTTLNLSLSGKGPRGGWARSRVCNIVGDGSSGKTLLALEACFWAWKNIKKIQSKIFPKAKKVIIVYNNCEGVMDFPLEKMYGQQFVDDVKWICTKNVEAFGRDYYRRVKNLKKGEFLLYIIDSWDAIKSIKDIRRFEEAVEKDEEEKGSYNLEKQKFSSTFFAAVSSQLESNKYDATLMIISQVRVKIGATFGKKTYRAGGKALDFYTHQVAWIREVEKMRKTKKKSKRVYGIKSEVKVERSKVAKPFRESQFTILYDYGLDDINSMTDFLWGKKVIRFDKKKFKTRKSFVKYVEENNREEALAKKVEKTWNKIEKLFEDEVTERKTRF